MENYILNGVTTQIARKTQCIVVVVVVVVGTVIITHASTHTHITYMQSINHKKNEIT